MSHSAVRAFIGDTAKAVKDTIQFGHGRVSEFNSTPDKSNECIWLDPLTFVGSYVNTNSSTLILTWSVSMFFYKKDDMGSIEKQYNKILDTTHDTMLKFVSLINRNPGEDSRDELTTDKIQISNFRAEPVVKVLENCMSGWILTFQLTAPDTFDYCTLYDS